MLLTDSRSHGYFSGCAGAALRRKVAIAAEKLLPLLVCSYL
jgi:hypothetical protein